MVQPVPSPHSVPHSSEEKEDPIKEKKTNWNQHITVVICIASLVAAVTIVAEVAFLIHENFQEKIWRPNPKDLEKKISENFSFDFIQKLKALSNLGLDEIRLFKRLSVSPEEEITIISYLEENFEISPEQLKEILMGAHVRLDDNGQTYEEWLRTVENKKSRISSHPSDTTQYGVQGSVIKELLFSRIKEKDESGDERTYTWFQLENHPVSFGHIIRHMFDYIKYKKTNENQGPYGSSKATHHAPLVLQRKVQEEKDETKN